MHKTNQFKKTKRVVRTEHVQEHTEYTRVARNDNTQSAQDWVPHRTHRVLKTSVVLKDTQYTGLDKVMTTVVIQDYQGNEHTLCLRLMVYP